MYAVIDLEMCKVPKRNLTPLFHWRHETIQIGAVIMNDDFEIIDHYSAYIQPEFGVLTEFIENLTGITQEDLDGGVPFEKALSDFYEHLSEDTVFVAWSDADFLQIQREIEGKELDQEKYAKIIDQKNWEDCQKIFDRTLKASHEYNLVQALNLAGIDYKEGVHNGYVDAYNTALLYRKLKLEKDFKWSEYFSGKGAEEKTEPLSTSLGSLLAGFQLDS